MNEINLSEKRELIQKLGKELFDRITKIPTEVRTDDKPRTGIQIIARELRTRNIVMESIYEPSEAARFFAVEKTVRTECFCDKTSQESQISEQMRFAGNVSIYYYDTELEIHVSVSGLKAEEDVLIAIIILSRVIEKTVDEVIDHYKKYAKSRNKYSISKYLPDQLFDENNYLNAVLEEYK